MVTEYFDLGGAIKDAAGKAGQGVRTGAEKVGEGVRTGAGKVGEGVRTGIDSVKNLPGTLMNSVIAPIRDFFLRIWGWFKYVFSVVCCLCIMSCCVSLGIPQTVYSIATR